MTEPTKPNPFSPTPAPPKPTNPCAICGTDNEAGAPLCVQCHRPLGAGDTERPKKPR